MVEIRASWIGNVRERRENTAYSVIKLKYNFKLVKIVANLKPNIPKLCMLSVLCAHAKAYGHVINGIRTSTRHCKCECVCVCVLQILAKFRDSTARLHNRAVHMQETQWAHTIFLEFVSYLGKNMKKKLWIYVQNVILIVYRFVIRIQKRFYIRKPIAMQFVIKLKMAFNR